MAVVLVSIEGRGEDLEDGSFSKLMAKTEGLLLAKISHYEHKMNKQNIC